MTTNFVLLQGHFEFKSAQDVQVKQGKYLEDVRQVDGFIHVGGLTFGGQHHVRLLNKAAQVAENWMRQRSNEAFPEVVIEGQLFTPPDGKAYVLVELIRFVGTRDLSNYPSHRRRPL